MASSSKNRLFCVYVAGLARDPITRNDRQDGIVEEDDLGWLFYDEGCNVADVRLMYDCRTGCCRGFAYVDFEDEKSFRKALSFDGSRPEKIRMHENGVLKVQAAKQKDDSQKVLSNRLAELRLNTAEMKKALDKKQLRVVEKKHQVHEHQARWEQVEEDIEVAMEEERRKQDAIRKADEALTNAEEQLDRILPEVVERTSALEALLGSIDGEQLRQHVVAAGLEDDASLAAVPKNPEELGVVRDIRKTFLDFFEPDDMAEPQPLLRTRTAPAYTGGYPPLSPSNLGQQSPSATFPPPAPWMLTREASITARTILENKMQGTEDEDDGGPVQEGLASASKSSESPETGGRVKKEDTAAEAETSCAGMGRWADEDDDAGPPQTPTDVRIRNLPRYADAELKDFIRKQLGQLWQKALGQSPPAVVDIRVIHDRDRARRLEGCEAMVSFARKGDAEYLVDGNHMQNWSTGGGWRAEWPAQPAPPDFRKFRPRKVDDDQSSKLSYETRGTRKSHTSFKGTGKGKLNFQDGQPLPRTIILEGISTSMPIHQVHSEILSLLKRVYKRDGYEFNAEHDLHRGRDGIEPKAARRPQDENGGSCIVRLRNYPDAKWLVDQARGRLSIEARPLTALWLKPRNTQATSGKGKTEHGKGKGQGRW